MGGAVSSSGIPLGNLNHEVVRVVSPCAASNVGASRKSARVAGTRTSRDKGSGRPETSDLKVQDTGNILAG
jgi:hypothetical protein